MGKRRIAIVGGGMAGLTAAFELTRTPALRARHCVTVYQIGWRLGGKGASSRDSEWRITEHGLHIWFGFYENAFGLLRDAYADWDKPADQSIGDLDQAFRAQGLTAIGRGDFGGDTEPDGDAYVPLQWPKGISPGLRGDGSADLSLWPCITQLIFVMRTFYYQLQPTLQRGRTIKLDPELVVLLDRANVPIVPQVDADGKPCMRIGRWLKKTQSWAKALADDASLRTPEQMLGVAKALRIVASQLLGDPVFRSQGHGLFLAQMFDVGSAVVKGVVVDIVIGGTPIAELDRMDFREWILANGAARDSVYNSRVVRALYDTLFQYKEGDRRRPSYGAGTAGQTILRMYGTYREAFAYEMRAGMGEVVIAPIYGVLKQRGVKFAFFHKLTGIGLSPGAGEVASLRFNRQAELLDDAPGYRATCPPTRESGFVEYWPDRPDWSQLKKGVILRELGLDFESRWCPPTGTQITLERLRDFDDIVLAIPLGAFKRLNQSSAPCDELIAASARFQAMTEYLMLVPSLSVQAWCTQDSTGLGAPDSQDGLAASSSGPSPLDIVADMSHLLAMENWGGQQQGPVSLQYLCDVLETELYRRPPEDVSVPAQATALARQRAICWFERSARYVWRNSGVPFDWSILFAPGSGNDESRIDKQYVRPNVDPIECCVGSFAGSTEYRLHSDESGFAHLYLAGSWILTGFGTECIEAAVMSGKQAARAICGSPETIIGEDFLQPPPQCALAEIAAAVLGGATSLAEDVLAPAVGRR